MKTTQDKAWQELFKAAILEVDPALLQEKIRSAHEATQQRRQELPLDLLDDNEAQQLTDASQTLRLLEKTELGDRAGISPQRGAGFEGAAI